MSGTRTRIKVCCILNVEEARLALSLGADAVGLVSAMPSGPGIIPEDLIAGIIAALPDPGAIYLLTSLPTAAEIIAQHRQCPAGNLQICDRLEPDGYRELREALPGVTLVQVIQVSGEEAVGAAERAAPFVDGLLLDSGQVSEGSRVLGGTGRVHDWKISRRIREAVSLPLWLAGGLTPENVGEAIQSVSPHGVDVCSGLRPDGPLDEDRLRRFIATAQAAPRPSA